MTSSAHLRGIVIAGALAALALALGFVTLAMNQTASRAATHIMIRPVKARHHESATGKPKVVKKVDPNLAAALAAGLPPAVARGLAASPVTVVDLTSAADPVAELSSGEARSGASLADAAYVQISVDRNGGAVQDLTRALGTLPAAPATLVYHRPATLFVTLTGFNDRTAVQQAAANAAAAELATRPAASTGVAAQDAVAASSGWAADAGALCERTDRQLAALGSPSPARLAAHKARFEAVAASFITRFKALTPAAGTGAKVARLDALLVKEFAAQDAMVAGSALHSASAVAAAQARMAALGPKIDALEADLGATGCMRGTA